MMLAKGSARHGFNNSGNLGNIFSKNTANQYNAKTNNKMNSFFLLFSL